MIATKGGYILTDMENEFGTLTDLSSIAESIIDEMEMCEGEEVASLADEAKEQIAADNDLEDKRTERAEYEKLIRTRFKEFYTDDTQKMINKRFKRYKAMEQRLAELEGKSLELEKRENELQVLLNEERERVERETEQRIMSGMLANRHRPKENGYAQRRSAMPVDVSTLTKSQRADLAKRAFDGEKISF